MMDENSKRAQPADARDVMIEAMLVSAIDPRALPNATGCVATRLFSAPR